MKFELMKCPHSVGEANYHLQFTPAYRRDICSNENVKNMTRDALMYAASRHGIMITGIGFGRDHVNVFVVGCKNYSVAKIVNLLKGISSRFMRQYFWDDFRDKLWGNKCRAVSRKTLGKGY